MIMQQARRRRNQASGTLPNNEHNASVGKTVLPLLRRARGGGGHIQRSYSSSKKRVRLIVFVVIIMVIICLELCFLKSSISSVDDNSQKVTRISSTDYADMTEFIPCIDDVSIEPYFSEIDPVLKSFRKKSRTPARSELSCSRKNSDRGCFRAVHDEFDDLLHLAKQKGHEDIELHNRIAVLIESLLLKPGVSLHRGDIGHTIEPEMLQVSVHRHMTYHSEMDSSKNNNLHADYLESSDYVYTAILYDDIPDDLVGGETALVNFRHNNNDEGDDVTFGMELPIESLSYKDEIKFDRPIGFTDGVIVEPKAGRLVLFSSGAENFHSPMIVRQGERPCYHFWYKCKDA